MLELQQKWALFEELTRNFEKLVLILAIFVLVIEISKKKWCSFSQNIIYLLFALFLQK